MTLTYNGTDYTVSDNSIYRDITIEVDSLSDAVTLVESLDGMSEYTFNNVSHSGMVVIRRSITIDGDILVNVKLRKKSHNETLQEEIDTLRNAMQELSLTTNKTTTAKIKKILEKKGVE